MTIPTLESHEKNINKLVMTKLSTYPLLEGQEVKRSEGNWESAQEDVWESKVGDEQIGHSLHVLVSNDDVANQGISKNTNDKDKDVNAVEEHFDRRSFVKVGNGVREWKWDVGPDGLGHKLPS